MVSIFQGLPSAKSEQVEQLQYEVLSKDFYIFLTRHLNLWCEETEDGETALIRKNRLINFSRTISGGKIYTLTDDIETIEFAWHDSNFLLIFRELDTQCSSLNLSAT